MGWASGFQAGSRLAGDILDTYNQAKQKREFEEIAKATPGLTYTEGQGQQLQAITEAKREDGTPYYSLTTDPQTGQYIVQSNFENAQGLTGEATKYTPGGQSFLGRTYDQGTPLTQQQMDRARMEAYAEAISKSDPIQGLRMRRDLAAEDRAVTAEQRAATAEQRAAQGFEAEKTLKGLQIDAAERQAKRDKGFDTAIARIGELKTAGTPVTSNTLYELASETGADFTALLNHEAALMGFKEKEGAATVANLKRDLAKASAKGVSGLNEFLAASFDPNTQDNIVPTIVKNQQGKLVVKYGDSVLSEYGAHDKLEYLVGTVQGFITGDPLGTLQTLAQINASNAQTNNLNAQAELNRARVKTADDSTTSKRITYLNNTADSLRKIIKDIDNNLANIDPASPQAKVLLDQRNASNRQLTSITTELVGQLGLTRQDGASSAENVIPKSVDEAIKSGINPVTKKPWTADEVKAFEDRTGIKWYGPKVEEKKEEPKKKAKPSPAEVSRQARGLGPRIPSPPKEYLYRSGRGGGTIKNPAYDEWEKEYGEAYRNQSR